MKSDTIILLYTIHLKTMSEISSNPIKKLKTDEEFSYMESLLYNPGFQHLAIKILSNLNGQNLKNCEKVSKSFKNLILESKLKIRKLLFDLKFQQFETPYLKSKGIMSKKLTMFELWPKLKTPYESIENFETLKNQELFLDFLQNYLKVHEPKRPWAKSPFIQAIKMNW